MTEVEINEASVKQSDAGVRRSTTSVHPDLDATRATVEILTENIGYELGKAKDLTEHVGDLHKRSTFLEWEIITTARGKSSASEMLAELGGLGFAWRDVARLLGVSVSAIQKWRKGESVSGESRRNIASLLAACDLITSHYGVNEIASWFEMPVLRDVPISPLDLYALGRHKLLFDYASGHADPEATLTDLDPNWRDGYRSEFEVFRADDGNLSIRPKAK